MKYLLFTYIPEYETGSQLDRERWKAHLALDEIDGYGNLLDTLAHNIRKYPKYLKMYHGIMKADATAQDIAFHICMATLNCQQGVLSINTTPSEFSESYQRTVNDLLNKKPPES